MSDDPKSLRRAGFALLAIGLGGFLADYVFNVGLSKLLSPHDYGDYRVAHAFAAFWGVAVLLGGDRAAPRMLSGPILRREPTLVTEYLGFYLRLALALSAAVIAITWLGSWFHVFSTDPEDHHAVAWVALSIPLSACGALISRALQSARLQTAAALPWRIGHPLLSLGSILLVAYVLGRLGIEFNVVHAVLVSTGAVGLVALGQWWLLTRRVLPERPRDPAMREPRRWLGYSLPMMGAFLIALALNQSDLYFLELLADEHDVGHYAAAMTTAHVLTLLQTTIVGILAPLVATALESNRADALAVRRRGQKAMVLAILPTIVLLALTGPAILRLFGDSYTDAAEELTLLAIGFGAWALAAFGVLWLQYTNRGNLVIKISAAILVVDSLLNALLIPRYGMLGAAASTAGTLGLAAVVVWLATRVSEAATTT